MKTLWSKYKIQHRYTVDEEELLSVTKFSFKKNSFKSFLVCSQSISNGDETAPNASEIGTTTRLFEIQRMVSSVNELYSSANSLNTVISFSWAS